MISDRAAARVVVLGIALPIVVVVLAVGIEQETIWGDAAARLLAGWLWFLARVAGRARVSWAGAVTAAVCLVLFAAGLHGFLRWLHRELARGPEGANAASRAWSPRWTGAIVALLVVMFAAGIAAAGLVHQAGWLLSGRDRWLERRWHSRVWVNDAHVGGNLRQISLGTLNFESSQATFPYLRTDSRGRSLHSWQTAILPYTPEGEFLGTIDVERPWDDPANSAYFRAIVYEYLNPAVGHTRDERGYGLSHYAGNVHVLGRRKPLHHSEVTHGFSNTILAGEAAEGFKAWGNPANLRDPVRGINQGPDSFGSPAGGEANLLFLDGSVRSFGSSTSPQVLRRLASPFRLGPVRAR